MDLRFSQYAKEAYDDIDCDNTMQGNVPQIGVLAYEKKSLCDYDISPPIVTQALACRKETKSQDRYRP